MLGLAVACIPFSVVYCHLALLIFLVVCIAEGNFAQKARLIFQNPLAWVLPVFFVLHVVSLLYSSNTADGLTNIDKKLAFFLAPLIIVSATPFTKSEIDRLAWIFIGACLLGMVICIGNAVFMVKVDQPVWNFGPAEPYRALHPDASPRWSNFSYLGLTQGLGIHPTYFGMYLLICILILLRNKLTTVSISLILYFILFIVLLSSRVVLLATLASIIAVAVFAGTRMTRVLVALSFVVVVATLLINPVALYRNAQEYTTSKFSWPPSAFSDDALAVRTSLWWLGLKSAEEVNPIIGTGTGDVTDTMKALADKYNVHNVLNSNDPHNQYLHTFIALGAVGLLWLIAVFLMPLWTLYSRKEYLACAGLISLMFVCVAESALELQKGIVVFVLFVSLVGNQSVVWKFSTQ